MLFSIYIEMGGLECRIPKGRRFFYAKRQGWTLRLSRPAISIFYSQVTLTSMVFLSCCVTFRSLGSMAVLGVAGEEKRDNLLLQTVALQTQVQNLEEFFSCFQFCAPNFYDTPADLSWHTRLLSLRFSGVSQEGVPAKSLMPNLRNNISLSLSFSLQAQICPSYVCFGANEEESWNHPNFTEELTPPPPDGDTGLTPDGGSAALLVLSLTGGMKNKPQSATQNIVYFQNRNIKKNKSRGELQYRFWCPGTTIIVPSDD